MNRSGVVGPRHSHCIWYTGRTTRQTWTFGNCRNRSSSSIAFFPAISRIRGTCSVRRDGVFACSSQKQGDWGGIPWTMDDGTLGCMVYVDGCSDDVQQKRDIVENMVKITPQGVGISSKDTPHNEVEDAMACVLSDTMDEECCGMAWYSTFDASRYFKALKECREDKLPAADPAVLITASKTASTQSSLQQRAGRLLHGTVFVADKQLGGRGRGGNTWESPDGCLMFSISLRYPGDGKTLPFVQYVVSLAIVDTIKSLLNLHGETAMHVDPAHEHHEHQEEGVVSGDCGMFPIRIKWPNDVYYCRGNSDPVKIGGVLCHSSYRESCFWMTIGVGINVSNAQPTTCLNTIFPHGPRILREDLVAGIVHRLVDTMLPQLASHGFDSFRHAYYNSWMHSGQAVRVKDQTTGQLISVRINGLTEHGYLQAIGHDNHAKYELCPDGNSFDFLQGLIVNKTVLPRGSPDDL